MTTTGSKTGEEKHHAGEPAGHRNLVTVEVLHSIVDSSVHKYLMSGNYLESDFSVGDIP